MNKIRTCIILLVQQKKLCRFLFSILIGLCFINNIEAQKLIRGTVKNADDNSFLPNASIVIEGTQMGTMANDQGVFELNLWQLPVVLQISHIGYRTERKIISVETPNECDILLKPKLLELDEIIVTVTHEYLQQLTQDGGWDGEWSPDGRQVLFCNIQNGNSDIWIQSIVSETPIRWTDHPAWDASPAWSPDGTTIAFTSYRDDTLKVWLKQVIGRKIKPVTSSNDELADDFGDVPLYENARITWSPDGKHIVFSKKSGKDWQKRYIRELWRKSIVDNSPSHQLVTGVLSRRGFANQSSATWSPDHKRMAFQDGSQIFLWEIDTNETRLLGRGEEPAWSPDGRWIAYIQRDSTRTKDIWVKQVDGNKVIRLTQTPTKQETSPRWSPDGQFLLFGMREAGYDLWSLSLNDSKLTKLASGIADADWSPDGDTIGFAAYTDEGLTLFTMLSSGGNWTALTKPGAIPNPFGGLSWSPDGQEFAGVLYGHQNKIWRLNIHTGGMQTVMDFRDIGKGYWRLWEHSAPRWSPNGKQLIVTAQLSTWLTHIWPIQKDGGTIDAQRFLDIKREWIMSDIREPVGELHPSWSPDGTQMAFTYATISEHPQKGNATAQTIWTTSIDNGEPTQLAEGFWPVWSPNGQKLLFLRQNEAGAFRELWTMPSKGGTPEKILGGMPGLINARWAPAGDRILFLTVPYRNLWIMSLAGTKFLPYLNEK